jgi:hypothetical protein
MSVHVQQINTSISAIRRNARPRPAPVRMCGMLRAARNVASQLGTSFSMLIRVTQ